MFIFSFTEDKALTRCLRSATDNSCKRSADAMSISSSSDAMNFHFKYVVELLVQSSHRLDMILSEVAEMQATSARHKDSKIPLVQRLDTAITKNFEAIQVAYILHKDSLRKQNALPHKHAASECRYLLSRCWQPRLADYPTCDLKNDGPVIEIEREYGGGFGYTSTLLEKALQAGKVVTDCMKKKQRILLWDSPSKTRIRPKMMEAARDEKWSDFRVSNYQVFDDSFIPPIAPSSGAR